MRKDDIESPHVSVELAERSRDTTVHPRDRDLARVEHERMSCVVVNERPDRLHGAVTARLPVGPKVVELLALDGLEARCRNTAALPRRHGADDDSSGFGAAPLAPERLCIIGDIAKAEMRSSNVSRLIARPVRAFQVMSLIWVASVSQPRDAVGFIVTYWATTLATASELTRLVLPRSLCCCHRCR